MSPLISIILPNYNHATFLAKRLESIYQQTYQNIEVILLDDCSEDDSVNLLKQFEHHPKTTQLIINKKNSGSPFKQWKKGIELAKGEYIWIAESDDWASILFLEKVLPVFTIDPTIALVYSQSKKVNNKGAIIDDMVNYTEIFKPNKWVSNFVNTGDAEIKNHLIYKNTIPNASSVVFKNEKYITKYINDDMTMAGDWWFWISLIKNKKIAFISERLNFHRSHGKTTRSNLTLNKKKKHIQEVLQILHLIVSFFPDKKEEINQLQKELVSMIILWVSPKDYKEIHIFLNETLSNDMFFPILILKAYYDWIMNKLQASQRRLKNFKKSKEVVSFLVEK